MKFIIEGHFLKSIKGRVLESGLFKVQIMFLHFMVTFKMNSLNIHQSLGHPEWKGTT